MNIRSEQTSQKLRGGYYTPKKITDFMTAWILSDSHLNNILEPSAGDGAFIESFIEQGFDGVFDAVELIEDEAKKIESKVKDKNNYRVYTEDFYDFYETHNQKYDAIIGNPPYIRYQYLSEQQRNYQSDILLKNGIKPNKLINSWMAFTVAVIERLNLGGRFAFVLPTDLLQVSYAKQLRQFLFENLEKMTVVTFKNLVFDNIQQDIVLLFGEKKLNLLSDKHYLRIMNVEDYSDLDLSNFDTLPFTEYEKFDSDKWTKFYLLNEDRLFYETTFLDKTASFNSYVKGEVGITTGNNDFFTISNDVMMQYNLAEYVRPLLGRSIQVNSVFYSDIDLSRNIIAGQKVWLLDFNGRELTRDAQNYINYGVSTGNNLGYKLQIRNRWYDVPSIWIPEAFLLRRIGEFPRIVINNIEATSTDTFHRLKVLENTNVSKFVFLLYSSVTLLSFELEGRVFGGGALEILPGDLKNIRIPKVNDNLDFEKLVKQLDAKFRKEESIIDIVRWVDSMILDFTVFSEAELERTFSMWQFLNKLRTKK